MLIKKVLYFGFFLFLFTAIVVFGQEKQNDVILDGQASGDTVIFDGFAQIKIVEGKESKSAALVFSPDDWDYKTTKVLTKGTRFYFIVGARKSSYVYTFAVSQPSSPGDSFQDPALVFPQARLSPLLDGGRELVLPAEDKAFALDGQAGTEYLVTLYTKQTLDIQAIMRDFIAAEGSLIERLSDAVGDNLLFDISYSETEAAFTAEANDPRAVAALIVAIEHR